MVESYRQRHGLKRPKASTRLGILLGLALVAFILLGLILRALGAGAVLLGLVLFALGLVLGWNARGQREPAQKVAALPLRPLTEEATDEATAGKVSPARVYTRQVLELDTPARTRERELAEENLASEGLESESPESAAEPVTRVEPVEISTEALTRAPETLPDVGRTPAETTERRKWTPRAKVEKVETPSRTVEGTVALEAQETTTLETVNPAVLEPALVEPATPERKKWTPKIKALDTLSGSESSSLEPEPQSEIQSEPLSHGPILLEVSAYAEIDLLDVKLPDTDVLQSSAPARPKWIPKARREGAVLESGVLEPAAMLEVAPTQLEPTASVRLDSRQILESMGIHLPPAPSSTPDATTADLSTPNSSEREATESSSGRKKWVPRRKV